MDYFVKHYNNRPWGESVIIITDDGCGTATVTFPVDEPETGLISDMSVHNATRQHGLGNCLLTECEYEIKQRGFKKAQLFAEMDSIAYNWYTRHGYIQSNEIQTFPQFGDDNIYVKLEKNLNQFVEKTD